MIGTVWEVQFTDEDFHIDLSQELYEECIERTRAFASTAIFLRARAEIKNLLCEQRAV